MCSKSVQTTRAIPRSRERLPCAPQPLWWRAILIAQLRHGSNIREVFGPARDVASALAEIFEAKKDWAKLADALEADAALAPESEKAAIFSKLGTLYAQRLANPEAAIGAHGNALALSPSDKASREGLTKLLTHSNVQLRLQAAEALEPAVRQDDDAATLGRVLEVRAEHGADAVGRLAAFEERLALYERDAKDRAKAIDWAGRGLAESVASETDIPTWIVAVDRTIGLRATPRSARTSFRRRSVSARSRTRRSPCSRAAPVKRSRAVRMRSWPSRPFARCSRSTLRRRISKSASTSLPWPTRAPKSEFVCCGPRSRRGAPRHAEQSTFYDSQVQCGALGKPEEALATLGELWEREPHHEGAHAAALEIHRTRKDEE